MKKITLLGCSGSIGTQTLDIIDQFPDRFKLVAASARGSDLECLRRVVEKFEPEILVIANEKSGRCAQELLKDYATRVFVGDEAHIALAAGEWVTPDIVVSALAGTSGVLPTIAAIKTGVTVALANKETLVTGGQFVINTASESGSKLLPVDSEHSAIYQCLKGIHKDDLKRLILTCSGGPFSNQPDLDLTQVTPQHALAHPTWNMGRKISIDSATLMNKGLEVIEAHWLFSVPQMHIDVILHPQSIIHSMIETNDGSVLAQMSQPDMRHPILFALSNERHWKAALSKMNLCETGQLTFQKPDTQRFPCLDLARDALDAGGTMPAVLNTANEIAVNAFCNHHLRFTDIPRLISDAMEHHTPATIHSVDSIMDAEKSTREFLLSKWSI